ncbi:hypothetical protein H4R24_003928 [Coemansia sp. RSA 988]|nr:hypothetical protein H4R24_003928 [Coemansia sp. RSA 988]
MPEIAAHEDAASHPATFVIVQFKASLLSGCIASTSSTGPHNSTIVKLSIEAYARIYATHTARSICVRAGRVPFMRSTQYLDRARTYTDDQSPLEESVVMEKIGKADDIRHEKFCKSFVGILRNSKVKPTRPEQNDTAALDDDKRLATEMLSLLRKQRIKVTPELLEKRKQLREQYPELFKDISDSELDG